MTNEASNIATYITTGASLISLGGIGTLIFRVGEWKGTTQRGLDDLKEQVKDIQQNGCHMRCNYGPTEQTRIGEAGD